MIFLISNININITEKQKRRNTINTINYIFLHRLIYKHITRESMLE